MAYYIIDRRKNDKNKSLVNKKRFLDRYYDQFREAVRESIKKDSIKDIVKSKQRKVVFPGKGLDQPSFAYSRTGGIVDYIVTGNDKYHEGDIIAKPPSQDGSGGGKGEGGSDGGENGQDSFSFVLSREDFMDIFFENCELPDLVRKELAKVKEDKPRRAGTSPEGAPNRLNILKSIKLSKARRFALKSPSQRKLKELEEELAALLTLDESTLAEEQKQRIAEIRNEIEHLKKRIRAVPFLDDVDLRYNRWETVSVPATQAVMFSLLDISGSMGEWEKEMAKTFFLLLVLFLEYNYEKVEMVWIIHTTDAKEVDEETFFHSHENGGTVVSTALRLAKKIIDERYDLAQWNIFITQISDGDNAVSDNEPTLTFLQNELLPIVQFYTYIQTERGAMSTEMGAVLAAISGRNSLYALYKKLELKYKNIKTAVIRDQKDIYPIFVKMFEKRMKNVIS